MIKTLSNKFRDTCGSVQSVSAQSDKDDNQLEKPAQKDRLPDCAYLLHAGFASTLRHRSKSA